METSNRHLSPAEQVNWLRLYRSQNVGPSTFFRLLQRFGTAGNAVQALPELARRGGTRNFRAHPKAAAEAELAALERLGGRLIASVDASFPAALKVVETAPLLSVLGNAALLKADGIAIVGAREASAAGRRLAHALAADLGQAGVTVVSGLARGIDTAAHRGALASGTVAVLAGGVDVVYPPENRDLYERICAEGCVVSEMPPGTQPQAAHFPRRNRLISGLSLGVVVVEAAARSGSLITARLALEQGRELFAVPGSPLDARAQGPNGLIKQGAVLTESAADVLAVLGPMRRPAALAPPPQALPTAAEPSDSEVGAAHRAITRALAAAPVTVDEILRQCQLSPAVLSMVLLDLELAGRLERHPGNRVALLG